MRKFRIFIKPTFCFILLLGMSSCDKNDNLVLFSTQDDIDLGTQVSEEIANDPDFDLLDRTEYADAYSYLDGLVNEILNSGEVEYRKEFVWDVTIINDDSTLNAFATPGGYIYVYTAFFWRTRKFPRASPGQKKRNFLSLAFQFRMVFSSSPLSL